MKKKYIIILSLMIGICISNKTIAQSLSVSGSLFLPQDSIGFAFTDPAFTSTDWIGIYKTDQTPGSSESISWSYIKSESGTLFLKAPQEAGKYKAYFLCCDGYNIVATSAEFSVEIPSLTTSFPSYVQGDSVVFAYVSPRYSSTDKIAIYTEGTKPGNGNQPLEWKYIPNSIGTLTFKTALSTGYYDAYLLCCDGIDSISGCNFEIIDQSVAFVTPQAVSLVSGANINLSYNDPAFASGDFIAIYKDGDLTTGPSITWSYLYSKSGMVSFPGNLAGGVYFAVLINNTQTEYARSDAFEVAEALTTGSYVKTSASVYPESNSIFVNYKDENFSATDWIGIYKKADIPGGGHESLVWEYAPGDSSTIEFGSLAKGDYMVYLCCCDGYIVKDKYGFSVVGSNTPSIVTSAMSYLVGETLEFTYNSPTFSSTDWVGIYHAGEIPGGSGVYSIWWRYLPEANGVMVFSQDDLGENPTPTTLDPGEYWAGLFCCDAYGLLAQTNFVVTDHDSGIRDNSLSDNLSIFPNPTNGLINIRMTDGNNLQRIMVCTLSGQVIYQENINGSVSQKNLVLKQLPKGIYFIQALTDKYKTSKKLIIQ